MKHAWKGLTGLLLVLLLLLSACGDTSETPEESAAPSAGAASPAPTELPAAQTEPPAELPEPERDTLVLWLAEDCPLCEELTGLAEEYAAEQPLSLRLFPDEAAMLAALTEEAPDLFLCSAQAASSQMGADELGTLTPRAETAALFRFAPGCVEGSWFPLGAEAPVLVTRAEHRAELESIQSWEELAETAFQYGRRWLRPYFSADSFARLFACAMEQKGSPFYAMREQDLESEDYRDYYNLLAEAAFSGGLVALNGEVLPAVANGELFCGVCSSRVLSQADTEGLAVLPLPPLEGCENLVDAQLWGLAVRKEADAGSTRQFIDWLEANGRVSEAALEAGLLPAEPSRDDAPAEGLSKAAESYRLWLPEADCGYLLRGEEFEQSFRRALALLA